MSSRRFLALFAGVMFSFALTASAQEWRQGNGRIEGTVTNAKGEPIVGASVSLRWTTGHGPDLKTDKKGKWAILGISGGPWNIDVSAPGYQARKTSISVSEVHRMPSIDLKLDPEVQQAPQEEVITVGGKKVSKETAAAIEKANAAMQAKDYATARQEYAKALVELPGNGPLLTNLEMSSYLDKQYDDALKYAKQILAADPTNTTSWLMVAEINLQKGDFEAGKEALSKVPDESIKDPTPYMNMGILYYNKNKPADAEAYFTKAIAKDANRSEAYFYRGLSRSQQKHHADAKADFQKYLELDPNGTEAQTAKDLLKAMK